MNEITEMALNEITEVTLKGYKTGTPKSKLKKHQRIGIRNNKTQLLTR